MFYKSAVEKSTHLNEHSLRRNQSKSYKKIGKTKQGDKTFEQGENYMNQKNLQGRARPVVADGLDRPQLAEKSVKRLTNGVRS
jgi:hypothetical protein